MKSKITVLLADDNSIVREGVRSFISVHPDLEVTGSAEDLESLLQQAEELKPQVVVTDIRMPPHFMTEGIDAPHYALLLLSQRAKGMNIW